MQLDVESLHAALEQRLIQAATGNNPFVTEVARHVISAGGKRFRPMLVFLTAELGEDAAEEDLLNAALVVELTHVASLYHDDVMDEAEIRRGVASANARWDNTVAILVGDFLFSRASDIVVDLGPEFVRLQARTFARLVQGQIAETIGPEPEDDPLEHYLQVVRDKTGSLIAASVLFGGKVAGVPQEQLDALTAYAEEMGVVFQLSDDLIDIMSDETGKTPGTDLREGVPTLPVLMLRQSERPEDQDLVRLIDSDLSDDEDLARVLELLRHHPVMAEAKAEVERRAQAAMHYLDVLPESSIKDELKDLPRQLVERTS